MNKQTAHKLSAAIQQCADNFSRADRAHNHTGEVFAHNNVEYLTANAALVTFKKNTGKLALFMFYFMRNYRDGEWRYFSISYDHIPLMEKVSDAMLMVERHNFPLNWNQEEPK